MLLNKVYKYLLYSLILFSCCSCGKNMPNKMPEDFNFSYRILGEEYDSKKQLFTRYYYDDSISVKVTLTNEEKMEIYNMMKQQNFNRLPDTIRKRTMFIISHLEREEVSFICNNFHKTVVLQTNLSIDRTKGFGKVSETIKYMIHGKIDLPPNYFGYE